LYAAGNVNFRLAIARARIEKTLHQSDENASPPAPPPVEPIATLDWHALFKKLIGIDLGRCPECGGHMMDGPQDGGKPSARAPPLDSS
jgi:hypothetical protein